MSVDDIIDEAVRKNKKKEEEKVVGRVDLKGGNASLHWMADSKTGSAGDMTDTLGIMGTAMDKPEDTDETRFITKFKELLELSDRVEDMEELMRETFSDIAVNREETMLNVSEMIEQYRDVFEKMKEDANKLSFDINMKYPQESKDLYNAMLDITENLSVIIDEMRDRDEKREERLMDAAYSLFETKVTPAIDKGKKWFMYGKYLGVVAAFGIGVYAGQFA